MHLPNRNVLLLTAAQALTLSSTVIVTLLGGIVGGRLAGAAALATLPVSTMILGTAFCSVPAALVMQRIGRRAGFVLAALLGTLAAAGAAMAIGFSSFTGFCLATFGLGCNVAFAMQYRYAAAESVDVGSASRAISTVLLGSLLAAYLGPEVAERLDGYAALPPHAGGFVGLALMLLAAAGILGGLKASGPPAPGRRIEPRALGEIVRSPEWLVAALAGTTGYGVMSFVMTATPVSMHVIDGHTLGDTAWVIQSHVMAMYLPSLVSGWLIARVGAVRIMTGGLACLVVCIALAFRNHAVLHYWVALVLLGVGWNFLFVASTTLIAELCRSAERFKAQALTDLLIFGTTATASLLSGLVIHRYGWERLLLGTLPALLAMAGGIIWLALRSRRRTAAEPA